MYDQYVDKNRIGRNALPKSETKRKHRTKKSKDSAVGESPSQNLEIYQAYLKSIEEIAIDEAREKFKNKDK